MKSVRHRNALSTLGCIHKFWGLNARAASPYRRLRLHRFGWPAIVTGLSLAAVPAMIAGCARHGLALSPVADTSTPDRRTLEKDDPAEYVRRHYDKHEYRIPMRDGVHLFTAVYTPKDTSAKYPFLLFRTPYSLNPYGEDKYPERLGRLMRVARKGYIFVAQDVRGRFMSEGTFVNMTPHIADKHSKADIDESSDTYDTIEWLLKNIPNHNGKVGMWGISYPGFYAAAGMIDSHPALRAVSPQAPIADWYFDDFHHHGAFFLPHGFSFIAVFGRARPEPTTEWGERFEYPTPDGYRFFLDLDSLRNVNDRYFHGANEMWNNMIAHPNYDDFWQSRNILPHLKNISAAVLTVGGWFDAEDLYGPLKIYRSVEEKNPGTFNALVMGPWAHGGWARSKGDRLGHIHFGTEASQFYYEKILIPFFEHHLRDDADPGLPEAYAFETGANRWRAFDDWPPRDTTHKHLFLREGGRLSFDPPGASVSAYDEYISDPAKPVPYTQDISTRMTPNYMTDDQRFAARRPDVLVYQTDVLDADVSLAGPILADLWVSTSGTASDWIVKLIDVFPPDAPDYDGIPEGMHMGDYQMMVRSEVIRGRYRNSYEHPQPFTPDEPANIRLELQDVLHTFQKGHRIMVHIQSTWFPLVDRNPQKYVDNIFLADDSDFIKATQRVYRSGDRASRLRVGVLLSPTD